MVIKLQHYSTRDVYVSGLRSQTSETVLTRFNYQEISTIIVNICQHEDNLNLSPVHFASAYFGYFNVIV